MITIIKEKIYIIIKNKATVDKNDSLYVKDVANVYSDNPALLKNIESVKVYNSKDKEDWVYLSVNDVIQNILDKYKNTDISALGATEILIEIKSQEPVSKLLDILKLSFVSVVLFFGAALGIIYFHEDVNMKETLSKLYFTFSGKQTENPLIMTVPYSFGLAIGMITFFKRIPSKSLRRRKEPGPLDVELSLYNYDVEQHILNELMKDKEG